MAKLKKGRSVRDALKYVENNPEWPAESELLDMPIWEYVARRLFEHAHNGDDRVVGSIGRATRASRIIMDRMTGTRRTGTAPAQRADKSIEFDDLAAGALTQNIPPSTPNF